MGLSLLSACLMLSPGFPQIFCT